MKTMKTRIDQKSSGFTLIEMLVVVAIVAVLSGAIVTSSFAGQKRYDLARAAQQMSADLRRAQNLALAGKMQAGVSPTGYGIYTNGNSYVLFYNLNPNKEHHGASVDMETIALPTNVSLAPTGASVYFVPPDPTTYINGASAGSLTFTLTNATYSKNITVYASGRIE